MPEIHTMLGSHCVYVFCPCSEPINSETPNYVPSPSPTTETPETLFDPKTHHSPPDLRFCGTCQSVKCKRCLESEVLVKYCPRCFTTFSRDVFHCQRNCFNCPQCSSFLQVSAKVEKDGMDKIKGKTFNFNCQTCNWVFDTGLITKPQSLYAIIKSLSVDEIDKRFQTVKGFYSKQYDYLKLQNMEQQKYNYSADLITKFSSLEIARLSQNKELPKCPTEILEQEYQEQDQSTQNTKLFPAFQPLFAKKSLRCKSCRSLLVNPDQDPLSIKFTLTSNATDILPEIVISAFKNQPNPFQLSNDSFQSFLLSFTNPLDESVEVTISTFEKLDRHCLPTSQTSETSDGIDKNSDNYITVQIPCSNFQINSRPEKRTRPEHFIRMIPTCQLTSNTKSSRVESLRRSPDSIHNVTWNERWQKSNTLSVSPLLVGDTTLDESEATTSSGPLDRGINWCTVRIDLTTIGKLSVERVNVPLFMSVKSKSYSFGTWVILDLAQVV